MASLEASFTRQKGKNFLCLCVAQYLITLTSYLSQEVSFVLVRRFVYCSKIKISTLAGWQKAFYMRVRSFL